MDFLQAPDAQESDAETTAVFALHLAANTLVFDHRPPEMCLCGLLAVTCRTISAL